jgi:hypothetical protein
MGRPWSKHRHWHDDRGRTHKQGVHITWGWPLDAFRARPPEPADANRTYPCDWCHAAVPIGETVCPSCGQETLPF